MEGYVGVDMFGNGKDEDVLGTSANFCLHVVVQLRSAMDFAS